MSPISAFLEPLFAREALPLDSPLIDVGCALGRATFEIAARVKSAQPVLGIDLNFTMLRFAQKLISTGRASYPRKRVGVVYDTHDIHYKSVGMERVDFWACDGMALPFSGGRVGAALSLNLLDCVSAPANHIHELLRVLKVHSPLYLSTPFDWSAQATPMAGWLGGHSQRTNCEGYSEQVFLELIQALQLSNGESLMVEEELDIPWDVRVHARNTIQYLSRLAMARKQPPKAKEEA